jgi:hypothetical protein
MRQKTLRAQGQFAVFRMAAAVAFIHIASAGYAQDMGANRSNPVVGGTYPMPPRTPLIASNQNTEILRHRDPAGRPCLGVGGYARAYSTQATLYDHVILATNSCAKTIKVSVCYYKSQQCVTLDVPGRSQREGTLGTMPSIKDFQFEFRERF